MVGFRADALFKETIEMIASCYKQQFNVSVIMLIMMNDDPLIYFSVYK